MSWLLDAAPPPKILTLPPGAVDLGEADAAIELWEHYSRKTLDPTQRLTVQVMMAQSADGRWAAATTGREMPRQNGKGDEIEVVELWGLVQRGEAILHTVHEAVLLASEAQQRMLGVLESHADLRRLVKRKWQGTGQQMTEMRNGGVIWYRTRSGGGGRGVDNIDRLVVDEAQHATEEHLAAVSPTLLANRNPQLNAMGTAGLAGRSEWWWTVRLRALSDDPGAFGYVGHTAEDIATDPEGRIMSARPDVTDRSVWAECNPALSSGRGMGMEFLEEQLRRLGPESFAREHLGVWDPPEGGQGSIIDPDVWADLEDMEGSRPSPVAFAVAMSPDRKWTTIGLAGTRADGGRHVQVLESLRKGAVDRVVELVGKWSPVGVGVDASSPAASLIPDLEQAGVPVVAQSQRDVARGCGMFVDAVEAGTLHHGGGDLLSISLGAARKRRVGETWVWAGPPDDSTSIAPLQAVTVALFTLASAKQKVRSGRVW